MTQMYNFFFLALRVDHTGFLTRSFPAASTSLTPIFLSTYSQYLFTLAYSSSYPFIAYLSSLDLGPVLQSTQFVDTAIMFLLQ